MNNFEQMIKVQTLIASHPDKLESILTAIESVLSPIADEGNSEVAVEEEKPYKWSKKDVNSFCYEDVGGYPGPEVIRGIDSDGDIETENSYYSPQEIKPYTETIKLHFKPWKAKKGIIPEDLSDHVALLFADGDTLATNDGNPDYWLPETDPENPFDSEVVGYCNLDFVNFVKGE